MQDLSTLRLILRYGRLGPLVVAVIVAIGIALLAWPLIGWGAPLAGLVAGSIGWLLLQSYVELISIIFQTVN